MDLLYNKKTLNAGVLELVDEVDSKSIASDGVRVRVPPPAPRRSKVRFAPTFFYSLGTKERHPPAPLLLLSNRNSLRSRWRLCRLTDAAYPLRVLRWIRGWLWATASAVTRESPQAQRVLIYL